MKVDAFEMINDFPCFGVTNVADDKDVIKEIPKENECKE